MSVGWSAVGSGVMPAPGASGRRSSRALATAVLPVAPTGARAAGESLPAVGARAPLEPALSVPGDRASGQLKPGFNYDIEPAGEPLPAEVLTEELRHFPRPPGGLPDWWAQRIGETG